MKSARHITTRLLMEGATVQEKQELLDIENLLYTIRGEVAKVRSAIALAETGRREARHIRETKTLHGVRTDKEANDQLEIVQWWPFIAAHTAIFAMFHIRLLIQALSEWSSITPLAEYLVDRSAGEKAIELLEEHFPNWRETRNALAHSGEMAKDHQRLAVRGPVDTPLIKSTLDQVVEMQEVSVGNVFTTVRDGKTLEFHVGPESYEKILQIWDVLLEGFTIIPERSPFGRIGHDF